MGVPLGGVEWSGISWHLRICRLLCHSVAPSARCACHSVTSSGTAMRQGVYGTAQGPSKRQVTPNGGVAAMAPSLPAKRNTLTRLRELVWVGGCVTALWRGPHRQGGDTGVYTDRLKWPLGAVSGHLCTLLQLARIVRATMGTQECTQIGGNGLSAPFWGICVHCCDASRDTNRDASCLRQVARAPQPPWRAGGASSLAPLAWSGRQALSEWHRCQVGIFAKASTHTNP